MAERKKMNYVFALNQFGKPLMPYHPAEARILLKENKAFVKRRTPFTIQLTVPVKEKLYPITLGVDAGYKHIGLSATTEKEELYASEIETRTDVSALLSTRRQCRHSRRNRKTRYRAPRFNNRVHSKNKGWLAPSLENIIAAHISRIDLNFPLCTTQLTS